MRIDRLELKGLTAFPGTIAIDCAALPQGLIAIVGPNGHGKTTLLEALGPAPIYREFPSRAEKELFDYATGADSYLDQTVTLDGRGTYRLRVNLDNLRRKTDAVIERVLADGTRQPLNDGKTSTFDAQVAALFPSLPMMLASAFAAQNRAGSFVTGSRSDRKELFAEMLDLGHLEGMSQTARTIATALERGRIALKTTLDALDAATTNEVLARHTAESDRLQEKMGRLNMLAEALAGVMRRDDADVTSARADMDAAKDGARERETLSARYRDRHDALAPLDADLDGVTAHANAESGAIIRRRDDALAKISGRRASAWTPEQITRRLTERLAQLGDDLRAALSDRDERIANNQKLLGSSDAIRAAVRTIVSDLQPRIVEAKAQLAACRDGIDTQATEIAAIRRALAALAKPQAELIQARRSAELLERMPCKGQPPYDGCEFLKDAAAAKARIVALEAQLAGLEAQKADLARREQLEADDKTQLRTRDEALATLERSLADAQVLAHRLPQLEAAETRIAELQAEQTQLRARVAGDVDAVTAENETAMAAAQQARADLDQETTDIQHQAIAELAALSDTTAARVADIETRRAAVNVELTQIAAQLATLLQGANLAALEQTYTDALIAQRRTQDQITAAAADHARVEVETAQQEARATELNRQIRARDAQRTTFAALDRDLVEWQVLAQALGKEGLSVLEMDAAGPVVSALCNDLLEYALGSCRFTVELVTQEAKSGGKGMKETFDLKVYDTDRGSAARDVSDLSGGEQVLIDEALKGAIALFNNSRNVQPMRTCFRDETMGALDPENALRYMAMLRRIQERGGFDRLFVISHNEQAAALADAQLFVHDGQVDVVYPPYGAHRAEAA